MTQQFDLFRKAPERTGPAQDDEADYPYRFMPPWLQELTRQDAERREREKSK